MFRDKKKKYRRRGADGWAKVEKGTDKDKPTKSKKEDQKTREIFEEAADEKTRKRRTEKGTRGWDGMGWVMRTKKNTKVQHKAKTTCVCVYVCTVK